MSPQNPHIIDLTDGNDKGKKNKSSSIHAGNPRNPTSQQRSPQHSVSPFASLPQAPGSSPPPRHGEPRASSFQHGHRRNSQSHRQHPTRDNAIDHQQGRKRKRNRTHNNATKTQTNSYRNKHHPTQLEQHQQRENYKRQRFGQHPGGRAKRPLPPQTSTKSNSSIWNAVHIEGIPSDFTPDQLRQFLVSQGLKEGSIQDMILPTTQDSDSLLQGGGYVVLKSSASFHQALVLSGLRLGSGHIRVVPAKTLPTVGQPDRVVAASDGRDQAELATSSRDESEQTAIHPPENNSTEATEKQPEEISSRNESRGTHSSEQSEASPQSHRVHSKSVSEINVPLVVDLVSSSDSEYELEGNENLLGQNSKQETLVSVPLQHCAVASANMVDQLHDTNTPSTMEANAAVAQQTHALIVEEIENTPTATLATPPKQPYADISTKAELPQEIAMTMELNNVSDKVHGDTVEHSPVSANGRASSTLQGDVAGSTEFECAPKNDDVSRFGVNITDQHRNTSSSEPLEVSMAELEVLETGEHADGDFEKTGLSTGPFVPSLMQGDNILTTKLEVRTMEEHKDTNTKAPHEVTAVSGLEMKKQLDGNSENVIVPPSQQSKLSPLQDDENAMSSGLREPLLSDIASEWEMKHTAPKPTSKGVATSEKAINSFLEHVHGFQNGCDESTVDLSEDDRAEKKHSIDVHTSSSQPDGDIAVVKVVSAPPLDPESNSKTSGILGTNDSSDRAPTVKRQRFRPVAPKPSRAPNVQNRDRTNIHMPATKRATTTTTVFPERRYVIHSASNRPSVQKKQQKAHDYRSFKFATSEEAQREQDRLLREAASRVRHKAQFHVTQGPSGFLSSNVSFPTPIIDVNTRYPSHWEFKDPYSRLGLPKGADMKLVKAHFRSLARIYHPDKSKTYETAAKFQAIAEAYHSIIST